MISKPKGSNRNFQGNFLGNFLWQETFQALGQVEGSNLLLSSRARKSEAGDAVRPLLQRGPSSISVKKDSQWKKKLEALDCTEFKLPTEYCRV